VSDRSPKKTARGTPAPRPVPERRVAPIVEVIAVGGDLLSGRVADENGRHIAETLTRRGARVRRITIVGDDADAVAGALREALERNPHAVVLSGGLGPAGDDVTLAGVGHALGLPLVSNAPAKRMVEEAYQRLYRSRRATTAGITRAREKLFQLPVGAEPLSNAVGLAPGIVLHIAGGAVVVCLPGMPREARAALEQALPRIDEHWPRAEVARRDVEAPVADEAELRPLLETLARDFPAVHLSSRPTLGRAGLKVYVTLQAVGPTAAHAEAEIHAVVKRLRALAAGAR